MDVTEIFAVTGVDPLLWAINEAIFPVPLDASPMDVAEFVQENEPPVGLLVKTLAGTVPLLHTAMFDGTIAAGDGLTVIV